MKSHFAFYMPRRLWYLRHYSTKKIDYSQRLDEIERDKELIYLHLGTPIHCIIFIYIRYRLIVEYYNSINLKILMMVYIISSNNILITKTKLIECDNIFLLSFTQQTLFFFCLFKKKRIIYLRCYCKAHA